MSQAGPSGQWLRRAAWKSAPDSCGGLEYRQVQAPAGRPGRAGQERRPRMGELCRRPRDRRARVRELPKPSLPARIKTPHQDALLGMKAVFSLVEDHRLRSVDDLVSDLIAPMGGQAMHEYGLGFCFFHQPGVDLVRLEQIVPPLAATVSH